ncbi:MAG: hypothetical protein NPIRA02_38930 [Nitrospirales bacterium]|nr:MAG: hypothetical protein NPIRA02_38930 [Nitrospirales bacterium]
MIMRHALLTMVVLLGLPFVGEAGQGDAMPGMASQGIVRLPSAGMVEQTFDRMRGTSPRPHTSQSFKWTSPRIDTKPQEMPSTERKRPTIEEPLDKASQVQPSGHYLTR